MVIFSYVAARISQECFDRIPNPKNVFFQNLVDSCNILCSYNETYESITDSDALCHIQGTWNNVCIAYDTLDKLLLKNEIQNDSLVESLVQEQEESDDYALCPSISNPILEPDDIIFDNDKLVSKDEDDVLPLFEVKSCDSLKVESDSLKVENKLPIFNSSRESLEFLGETWTNSLEINDNVNETSVTHEDQIHDDETFDSSVVDDKQLSYVVNLKLIPNNDAFTGIKETFVENVNQKVRKSFRRKKRKILDDEFDSEDDKADNNITLKTKKSSSLEQNEMYCCRICYQEFKTIESLNKHHHVNQESSNFDYLCQICIKTFETDSDYDSHQKEIHLKFLCHKCFKVYQESKQFEKHQMAHKENATETIYKCKNCTQEFISITSLTKHRKMTHQENKLQPAAKKHSCLQCDKSFTRRQTLVQHVNTHNGIKPHKCEVCSEAFSYVDSLRSHMITHGVVKKIYTCEYCQKTFPYRASYLQHKNIHEPSTKYTCDSCGKEFTQKSALVRHGRIHSGLKPYKCEHCQRCFSDSSILRRHLKTHR